MLNKLFVLELDSAKVVTMIVLFWSILLKSVFAEQLILTPDDIRIYRENDKFLYKQIPQVRKNNFETIKIEHNLYEIFLLIQSLTINYLK